MVFPKFFLITGSIIAVPGLVFGGLWIKKIVTNHAKGVNLLKKQYKIIGDEWVRLEGERNILQGEIEKINKRIEEYLEILKDYDLKKRVPEFEKISEIKKELEDLEEKLNAIKVPYMERIKYLEMRSGILKASLEDIRKQLESENINSEEIEMIYR